MTRFESPKAVESKVLVLSAVTPDLVENITARQVLRVRYGKYLLVST